MEVTAPAWAIAAAGVILVLGGAAIGFYTKWRKAVSTADSDAAEVVIKGQRATTDLNIHIRDDVVDAWAKKANDAEKRADAADARCSRLVDEANKRTDEANARADRKDDECGKRMEQLVTRYREREGMLTKQHQEREIQFQSIVDERDKKCEERMDQLARAKDELMRENGKISGRLYQVEKQLEEVQVRLDARDMRRGGKRRDDPPQEDGPPT